MYHQVFLIGRHHFYKTAFYLHIVKSINIASVNYFTLNMAMMMMEDSTTDVTSSLKVNSSE